MNDSNELPSDRYYTPEHIWVLPTENGCLAGLTDYAQAQLGDVVFLDIEASGEKNAQDDFGSIESAKAVSTLHMPLAGIVTEINPALAENPGLVNTDCYGKGWLIRIMPAHREDINNLLDNKAYLHILGK